MIDLPIKANVILNKKWTGKIVDFEIMPVKYNAEDEGCDRCLEGETPDAYGIYLRMEDKEGINFAEWIADFDNKEAAEAIISLLQFILSQNSNADQLPADTHGLVHLPSVGGYYDRNEGQTFDIEEENGIKRIKAACHLEDIEVGDWFRSLTDSEWQMITTGAYDNPKGYSKEGIGYFVDHFHDKYFLSDVRTLWDKEDSDDCLSTRMGPFYIRNTQVA